MTIRPILVTGSHRSGSTWVGQMLAAEPSLVYIHEPFSVLHRPGLCDAVFPYWFPYICKENQGPYLRPIREMLELRYQTWSEVRAIRRARDVGRLAKDRTRFAVARRRHARPLLKDPIAVFSAEWLWETFEVQPVVLIRHPAAFASSLKRLGWTHPFQDFLAQPLLMRDLLGPFEDEIRAFAEEEPPVLDQAVLLWKLIHSTIVGYRERHADWLFVRHEDVARDPLTGFGLIFDRLDIPFTATARRLVAEHSDPTNPTEVDRPGITKRDSRSSVRTWTSRLTEQEVERVRRGVGEYSAAFYSDAEW